MNRCDCGIVFLPLYVVCACFVKILSRVKPAVGGEAPASEKKKKNKGKKTSRVEDYLILRDYLGAITLLEVKHLCTAHTFLLYLAMGPVCVITLYIALSCTETPLSGIACGPVVWQRKNCHNIMFLCSSSAAQEKERRMQICGWATALFTWGTTGEPWRYGSFCAAPCP